MITAAITALKERKGPSLSAIKKYILANYKIEEKSVSTFCNKNLKQMVASGAVKQTKGSFKLVEKPKARKAAKSPKKVVKKTTTMKAAKLAFLAALCLLPLA